MSVAMPERKGRCGRPSKKIGDAVRRRRPSERFTDASGRRAEESPTKQTSNDGTRSQDLDDL
jgi:hypothetical protein